MTELFKIKAEITLEFVKGSFEFDNVPYNLRSQSKCNRSIPCPKRYTVKKIFYRSKTMGRSSCRNEKYKYLEEFIKRIDSWFPKTVLVRYINCSLKI